MGNLTRSPMNRNPTNPETDRLAPVTCPCGAVLTEDEIRSGYTDAMTGQKLCEGCWDAGEPLEGPNG